MACTSELSLEGGPPLEATPEIRLDAKLRAMEAARMRRPVASLLPDLSSLPQPGASPRGGEPDIGAAGDSLNSCAAPFDWQGGRARRMPRPDQPGLHTMSMLQFRSHPGVA